MRELHSFPGGLKLETHKALSSGVPIRNAGIPDELVLRLRSPIGTRARPLVKVGDRVLKGQPLAEPGTYVSMWVHAPTSGRITAIGEHAVPHPSGLTLPCIRMEPDGLDEAIEMQGIGDYRSMPRADLLAYVQRSGIIGLGGAGFPSHVKLREGLDQPVETLIINGVECEPWMTCDERLMRERAEQVIEGARILQYLTGAGECVIAVEEDMPEALQAMQATDHGGIEIVAVPAVYPQGGEKQLIQTLTGKEVPGRGLPIHIGMLVHNVASVVAIYRWVVLGEPLLSRIVTVTGELPSPGNFEVLIGTPMRYLLEQAGWVESPQQQIVMGGPMMGLEVASPGLPVIKVTNCLLVRPRPDPIREAPCIRCGDCVSVCPVGLLPQVLLDFTRARDYDRVQDYNIFDCIECGCCAHVCPSRIPLVHYYRFAKSEINALDRETSAADGARQRYRLREERLLRQQQERREKREEKLRKKSGSHASDKVDRKAEIQAAIQRTREKRQRLKQEPDSNA